ncbi:MAG: phage tail protein [Calditrichae bacterium]|nr:phage tail protein [Calditrichia bacterium]
MSEPFLAEIKIVGFNFAPRGYAFCDGQILPINQNQSLYSLLGTTYGGDGRITFALPDLKGRTPIHTGTTNHLGNKAGTERPALSIQELPVHTHQTSAATSDATLEDPTGNIWAADSDGTNYGSAPPNSSMSGPSLASIGGGQQHNNMQPYLALNFVIALRGLFPSRN